MVAPSPANLMLMPAVPVFVRDTVVVLVVAPWLTVRVCEVIFPVKEAAAPESVPVSVGLADSTIEPVPVTLLERVTPP